MSRYSKLIRCVPGSILAVLLSACGGAGDDSAVVTKASVRIEGCVVDQYYVPNEGVPVRVVAADGRVLAKARSGKMGEFSVQVPAGESTGMSVDRTDGDWLPVPVANRDQVVDSCLVARG